MISKNSIIKYPDLDYSKIQQKYLCPECKQIMINVHQADSCGCRYCYACLDKVLKFEKICKGCNVPFESNKKYTDKHFEKNISNLIVKCNMRDCLWSGKLIDYNKHYDEHYEPKFKKCKYCHDDLKTKEENEYTGNCLKQPVKCIYKSIGCVTQSDQKDIPKENDIFTREELNNHMELNCSNHLKLVYDDLNNRIKNIEEDLKRFKVLKDKSNNVYESKINLPEDFSNLANLNNSNLMINQLSSSLKIISNNENMIIQDISKLTKQIDKFKQENMILKEKLLEYNNLVHDLQKVLAMSHINLVALEERLLNVEKISYDGTLIWKITNVQEKMQEARSGRQTSFYSPPFYTSRNGYKMCARIYLNGDGSGKNTHLSLFFVILRGDYDALLKWPFKQKVGFILIDQSFSKDHIIDTFKPDPNSSSFIKPISNMNLASGLPLFCPLEKFKSPDTFIKDNTAFIKIVVDTKNLTDILNFY